jgi:hypothetical protein
VIKLLIDSTDSSTEDVLSEEAPETTAFEETFLLLFCQWTSNGKSSENCMPCFVPFS